MNGQTIYRNGETIIREITDDGFGHHYIAVAMGYEQPLFQLLQRLEGETFMAPVKVRDIPEGAAHPTLDAVIRTTADWPEVVYALHRNGGFAVAGAEPAILYSSPQENAAIREIADEGAGWRSIAVGFGYEQEVFYALYALSPNTHMPSAKQLSDGSISAVIRTDAPWAETIATLEGAGFLHNEPVHTRSYRMFKEALDPSPDILWPHEDDSRRMQLLRAAAQLSYSFALLFLAAVIGTLEAPRALVKARAGERQEQWTLDALKAAEISESPAQPLLAEAARAEEELLEINDPAWRINHALTKGLRL